MTIRIEARPGHNLGRMLFSGVWDNEGPSLSITDQTRRITHAIVTDPYTVTAATYWNVKGFGKDKGGIVNERLIKAGETWVTRRGPIFIGEKKV